MQSFWVQVPGDVILSLVGRVHFPAAACKEHVHESSAIRHPEADSSATTDTIRKEITTESAQCDPLENIVA